MLLEVDGFFVGASKVHDTLQRVARRLSELNVDSPSPAGSPWVSVDICA
jgi:hypothetical protein